MDGNFFFVLGIILVIAAVGLAFVGIRSADSFPPSRGLMAGVIVLFAALVGTTMAFAIVKATDEQTKRNEQLAKENEKTVPVPPPLPGGQPQASGGGNQQPPQPVGQTTQLAVSSPADGGLTYQPNGLEAPPGNIIISYDNPSPVPHSIAVANQQNGVLGEVQPFTNGKQTVDLTDVPPGQYVFYCTVPGHREAGMQGDLIVTGGGGSSGSNAK